MKTGKSGVDRKTGELVVSDELQSRIVQNGPYYFLFKPFLMPGAFSEKLDHRITWLADNVLGRNSRFEQDRRERHEFVKGLLLGLGIGDEIVHDTDDCTRRGVVSFEGLEMYLPPDADEWPEIITTLGKRYPGTTPEQVSRYSYELGTMILSSGTSCFNRQQQVRPLVEEISPLLTPNSKLRNAMSSGVGLALGAVASMLEVEALNTQINF